MLDGFLLLGSCQVNLPHEAIRSKLSSENIVDVREEDLVYFKNLTYLDISDNSVNIESLINLVNLEVLDMQYNNLDHIEFPEELVFTKMNTLYLSYNKIPPGHLLELSKLPKLKSLHLASNDLLTLPDNMNYF